MRLETGNETTRSWHHFCVHCRGSGSTGCTATHQELRAQGTSDGGPVTRIPQTQGIWLDMPDIVFSYSLVLSNVFAPEVAAKSPPKTQRVSPYSSTIPPLSAPAHVTLPKYRYAGRCGELLFPK